MVTFGQTDNDCEANSSLIYQYLKNIKLEKLVDNIQQPLRATLAHLRGHERGISSSADPHAVEGQLQTGVALGKAAAKVTDH